MPTYLYGLLRDRDAARVPPGARGVADAPVRVLPCDDLAALVASIADLPPAPTVDLLRAHDRVVQGAVDAGVTVAAVRFGQALPDDDAVCRHTRAHGAPVLRLLEQFDGCVEMRLLMPNDALPGVARAPAGERPARGAEGPGHAYLAQLRERLGAPSAPGLRRLLGAVVRAEEIIRMRGDATAFAHLVQRADLADYRGRIAALPALAAGRLVGPLAIYSFVETAP